MKRLNSNLPRSGAEAKWPGLQMRPKEPDHPPPWAPALSPRRMKRAWRRMPGPHGAKGPQHAQVRLQQDQRHPPQRPLLQAHRSERPNQWSSPTPRGTEPGPKRWQKIQKSSRGRWKNSRTTSSRPRIRPPMELECNGGLIGQPAWMWNPSLSQSPRLTWQERC